MIVHDKGPCFIMAGVDEGFTNLCNASTSSVPTEGGEGGTDNFHMITALCDGNTITLLSTCLR